MAYETEYTDFDPQEDSSACLTLGLATDIVESRYLRDFSTLLSLNFSPMFLLFPSQDLLPS